MRAILALCAVVSALAIFAAAEIKLSMFNGTTCNGSPYQMFNITERSCWYGGDMFSCHSNPFTMCYDVTEFKPRDTTCDPRGMIGNVSGICGQCNAEVDPRRNVTEYSIVSGCANGGSNLTFQRGCNPTCTKCRKVMPMHKGQCISRPHDPKHYKFLGVRRCPTTITFRRYTNESTCTGPLRTFSSFPANVCFPGDRNSRNQSFLYQCV